MLKADQLIALAMHEECRAVYLVHEINITEPIIDDVLQHIASLLPHYVPNRHEGAHQKQCTWLAVRSEQTSRA